MYKQIILLLISLVLLSTCSQTDNKKDSNIIGVKIYKYDKNLEGLITEWKSMGINTAFADENLITNKEFMHLCKKNNIATYFIARTFFNPEKLQKDSTLYAITNKGKKAIDDWVHFVCPTNEQYRKERVNYFKEIIEKHKPDGISIDFIRYFVFWEMIYQDTSADSLVNSCFCDHCLSLFQNEANIEIPESETSVLQKANWITANKSSEFETWKCKNISSMVSEIVKTVKEVKPDIKVNTHIVPWKQSEYNFARKRIAGQDIKELVKYADYVSPMCYSFMLKRKPEWIRSLVEDFNKETDNKVLPSIQVKESYLSKKFTVNEFEKCFQEALKKPSRGVVFWSWNAFEQDPEKKDIIKQVLKM